MRDLLGRVTDGARTGAMATLPMSALMLAADALGIMDEPAPDELTQRILEALGRRKGEAAGQHALATVGHFGYGAAIGALYSLVRDRLPLAASPALQGTAYGLAVWLASYRGWIPALRLMPPPQRDVPGRPSTMIAAHVVFGAALGRRLTRLEAVRTRVRPPTTNRAHSERTVGRPAPT